MGKAGMVDSRFPGSDGIRPYWLKLDEGTLARRPSPIPGPLLEEIKKAQEKVALDWQESKKAKDLAKKAKELAKIVSLRAIAPSGPCSFVNPKSQGTVSAPSVSFNRLRSKSGGAAITVPVEKAAQVWWQKGPSFAALEQFITLGGQRIRVIRPPDAEVKDKNLPTTAQIAEALRAVPAAQRSSTTKIFVSPVADPGSTEHKTVAGTGGAGEIVFFPVKKAQSQNDFDNRMTHESGHNFQSKFWKDAAGGKGWQKAADLDKRRPSPYAADGPGEDFSEFNILYNTTLGTPCEKICRQIYPHRWAKLDEYLKRKG
jgi:hypothetical protein